MSRKQNEEYMTNMDKIGMQRAAKEELETHLGLKESLKALNIPARMESLEDLVKRDEQRQEDGFKKKIKYRRIITGNGKVVVIPYVEKEKLYHGEFEPDNVVNLDPGQFTFARSEKDITTSPGSGKGNPGDVIGETPLPFDGEGDGDGDEDGDGDDPGPEAGEDPADHEFEEEAYELGEKLQEQLELPNLTEKRKRFPTDEYTYELTDTHRGSGQKLDIKKTLKEIVKTNLQIGRIDPNDIDITEMVVDPNDKIYRILSKERIWKSQAVVCFLRDYSGSMWGEPTEALVAQHLMLYSWLLVQYEKRVIPRFFVHDTECREVTPRQYFGLNARGGTRIASGYKKINQVVESEGLAEEYDIFVFQGSDGDDWQGEDTIPELEKILSYASRVGVTLFRHPWSMGEDMKTIFEQYIEESGILDMTDVFRMHVMPSVDDEALNIEAIKALTAQD